MYISLYTCIYTLIHIYISSVQFRHSVASNSLQPPGLPVHHELPESTEPMSIESVMPSNHLILCHPLLLLPSIFPSTRVFSNEYMFPFLLCLLILFFFQLFVRLHQDNHFALLHFFLLGMVLITASCAVLRISVHISLGTLSDLIP